MKLSEIVGVHFHRNKSSSLSMPSVKWFWCNMPSPRALEWLIVRTLLPMPFRSISRDCRLTKVVLYHRLSSSWGQNCYESIRKGRNIVEVCFHHRKCLAKLYSGWMAVGGRSLDNETNSPTLLLLFIYLLSTSEKLPVSVDTRPSTTIWCCPFHTYALVNCLLYRVGGATPVK